MKLVDWKREAGLSDAALAKELGVGCEAVRRYQLASDHPEFQVPRRPIMRRIHALTGARVTPNDFHDLAPASGAAA